MQIVDVRPEHLEQIENIEKLCFSSPWNLTALEHQMTGENNLFLAAVDESGVLGYIGMLAVLDEGYISNVAVSPGHRRRGIGDALITELLSRISDTLAFVTLEVRASNAPAIALYAKHGFTEVGRRHNYYEKPREDAILMTAFFKSEA